MSTAKSIDFLFNQMRNAVGDLAAGTATFYYPTTTTYKKIYLDRSMGSEASNPYTLSADATAELFGNGLYRIIFKDSSGTIIYDYDNVDITDVTTYLASSIIYIAGSLTTPVDLVGKTQVTVIKSDSSATTVVISDSSGKTIMGMSQYELSVEKESVNLILPTDTTDWVKI